MVMAAPAVPMGFTCTIMMKGNAFIAVLHLTVTAVYRPLQEDTSMAAEPINAGGAVLWKAVLDVNTARQVLTRNSGIYRIAGWKLKFPT